MRVVIADDSVLLREGVARVLADAGHHVVAQLGDATGLAAVVSRTDPDVVVLDIRMPPTYTTEGLEAALALRLSGSAVAVVLLSQYVETRYALDLMDTGAEGMGYLLKDRVADIDAFVAAVERVTAGGTAIDPEVVARLVSRERRNNPLDALSDRQREVLALMAEGRSNRTIAEHLVVNTRTVESHVSSILAKLGISALSDDHRRVKAVLAYLGHSPV